MRKYIFGFFKDVKSELWKIDDRSRFRWSRVFVCFFAIVIWTLFILLDTQGESNALMWATCAVFVGCVVYALRSVSEHIFLLCFLGCFFTFLLAGQVISRFFPVYDTVFSWKIEQHTDLCLLLSLISLMVGYFAARHFNEKVFQSRNMMRPEMAYDCEMVSCVRRISLILFYCICPLWFLVLYNQVSYVAEFGYTDFYLNYTSNLPTILRSISGFAPVCFVLFLATMPKKKQTIVPILLYLIYSVGTLGTGRRLYAVTGVLLVFAYTVYRNNVNSGGKPWFSKKMAICLIAIIPLALSMLYLFEYVRSDAYVGEATDYFPLFGFFVRQGTSVNVIKYAEYYSYDLNEDALYSLHNTIWTMQNNLIGRFFFNFKDINNFSGQTVEYALNGDYLANYISYKVNPETYALGMGIGSCYIAELYVDFGYVGVCAGNLIYGFCLYAFFCKAKNLIGIVRNALGFYIVELLLKAPRATFDEFFAELLRLKLWATIIMVVVISFGMCVCLRRIRKDK